EVLLQWVEPYVRGEDLEAMNRDDLVERVRVAVEHPAQPGDRERGAVPVGDRVLGEAPHALAYERRRTRDLGPARFDAEQSGERDVEAAPLQRAHRERQAFGLFAVRDDVRLGPGRLPAGDRIELRHRDREARAAASGERERY